MHFLTKVGVVLTIEILFSITEATSFRAKDECMSMLYPILRNHTTTANVVKIMFKLFKVFFIHGVTLKIEMMETHGNMSHV